MRFRILVLILVCGFIGNTAATDDDGSYTLYLVRHAEKQQDGTRDPSLTEKGEHRAQRLAEWLRDKDIEDIWSSDYERTRETARPLLSILPLKLNIYDPRDLNALAKNLLNKGNNAFIVGHSNTTPELARLLCQCDVESMDETEYDRLIVVSISTAGKRIKTLQQNRAFQP